MPSVVQVLLLSTLSLTSATGLLIDGQGNVPNTLPAGSATEQLLQVTLAEEKLLRMRLEQEVKRLNGTLEQEITRLSATVQGEVAALKREVQQLKSGRTAIRGNFIAFEAGIHDNKRNISPKQKIIFDVVRLNMGNAYNKTNGIFTAPANGTYSFNAILTCNSNGVYVHLLKNGVCQGDLFVDFNSKVGLWGHFARSFLLHLIAGEKVWLEDFQRPGLTDPVGEFVDYAGNTHASLNQFSGFLVRADEE